MSDLGALPPEVSSALIYSGPGSSSLTAAASAWNAVAAELASTAQGLDTVVTQLAGESWLGPTSAAMVAAVQPYVAWVSTTAGQAEQTAAQASAAAAAFETVFASVVPPPLIAANRAELAQAVQTNVLGLNNSVIAQLEAQYGEFWSQNASALYSYAASSAAATKIESFTDAPAIANPAGALAAAANSTTASPATSVQSWIQGLLTNVQARIQSLTGPFIGNTATSKSALSEIWFLLTGQTALPTNIGTMLNGFQPFASFAYNTEGLPYFSVGMGNFGTQIAKSAGWLTSAAPAAAAAVPKGIGGLGGVAGGAGSQVAAGLGHGAHVAGLSVPHSWPGSTLASATKPVSAIPVSEPITAGEGGAGNLVGGMPVGGTGAARGAATGPRYGFKPTIMARPLPAG
ncbi:PPE family protein [Mycobacterium conspicuum]|jgi:PPE-repeat protein|uniref:PPE family protein n=1 Tax=Mycobacterium conspicuum TaxID=44010 RepID=A0A7I7YCY7_9MYCO|nr:PPE family protein [Mycobacterium conspicuum]BBZ39576.1 PPE family protein [Mycobacterium conspicuum]